MGGEVRMARLHEYQAKAILKNAGVQVPRGRVARSADEARSIAAELGGKVVVKIQAWTTGRKALGGVAFADSPEDAAQHADRLLGMMVGQFPVEAVIVEEQLPPKSELFYSMTIDDRTRAPMLLLAASGGSGVEDRAREVFQISCHVTEGPDQTQLEAFIDHANLGSESRKAFLETVRTLYEVARKSDARSLEVNPLAFLEDGRLVALDCRATIDDYAVYRHPEFGIEIARELDHPPTKLERIAYEVEQADHRGTFYFAQLATEPTEGSHGLVGFHGAGGGGSMMSMDAITAEGFTIANFTDTSGNPSASKVYRAARIILSQPGLCGYFGSGSGVASQEQFWSAYGLAKAFWELQLSIPAVIRLGGNSEDRAVEILDDACKDVPAIVEGYRKDDTPGFIARRFAELVEAAQKAGVPDWKPRLPHVPDFVGSSTRYAITGGYVWVNEAACTPESTEKLVAHSSELFKAEHGKPVLAVEAEELAKRDSELIALEVELRRAGMPIVFVELEISGLDA